MDRTFIILGSIAAFLGVGAGAFGAHGLRLFFETHPGAQSTYQTAVSYHMYHALALLAVAWAGTRWTNPLIAWAGYLFVLGILLFSGSLYALSLFSARWLGAVTPFGGVAFLGGWALLAVGAWRG